MQIDKLRKRELLWLASHKCSHSHTYLSHFSCAVQNRVSFTNDKVLLVDLETSANQGFFWGKDWDTSIIETIQYGQILCFAAKWLGSDKMIFHGWNEKKLVKELWKLFDEADVIVAHNGKAFDCKWATTKFIQYGLSRPSKYKILDTLTEAKKQFYLPSYKLNIIADYFKLGQKISHEGFSLWKKCIKGDKKARKKMEDYNKNDVLLLERVYQKLTS